MFKLKEYVIDFENWYKKEAFEYLVGISLLALIILYFMNDRRCGTYSQRYLSYSTAVGPKLPYHEKERKESKPEAITRNVLQRVFKKPFISIRPRFLYNPVTGKNLEIDCYNHDLRLGVEYNGRQHEEFVPHFHRYKGNFRQQRYRDEMKKLLCEKNGITLISIPSYIPYDKIENYLINQLNAHGYPV